MKRPVRFKQWVALLPLGVASRSIRMGSYEPFGISAQRTLMLTCCDRATRRRVVSSRCVRRVPGSVRSTPRFARIRWHRRIVAKHHLRQLLGLPHGERTAPRTAFARASSQDRVRAAPARRGFSMGTFPRYGILPNGSRVESSVLLERRVGLCFASRQCVELGRHRCEGGCPEPRNSDGARGASCTAEAACWRSCQNS
jgi:hypothetical protein